MTHLRYERDYLFVGAAILRFRYSFNIITCDFAPERYWRGTRNPKCLLQVGGSDRSDNYLLTLLGDGMEMAHSIEGRVP